MKTYEELFNELPLEDKIEVVNNISSNLPVTRSIFNPFSGRRKRKTVNWKKEYSTSYLRQQGGRNFKIISTDKLKWFGQHLSTIFTKDIQKSILNTGYDLTKIRVEDESGNDVKLLGAQAG